MKENEWISIYKSLPPLDKWVEILYEDGKIFQDTFFVNYDCPPEHIEIKNHRLLDLTHWRHIVRKNPDFSKLEKDDFVMIDLCGASEGSFPAFILNIENGILSFKQHTFDISHQILIRNIKKITRIKLEDKTFEEI